MNKKLLAMMLEKNIEERTDFSGRCIHQLFEQHAIKQPDVIAVVYNGEQITYGELNRRSNQLARFLRKNNVGPDVLVGLYSGRSMYMVTAMLGILKAGGAYLPLDPEYPRERLLFMLHDSNASVLITQHNLKGNTDSGGARIICLEEDWRLIEQEDDAPLSGGATPDNFIYVIYTSGSTGKPKGSYVFHRGFTNLLDWYTREFAFTPASRVLLITSLSFDLTQKNIFAPLITGGQLVLLETQHYDAGVILTSIEKHHITSINCTPSAFYGLVGNGEHLFLKKLESLQYVFLGGEPIATSVLNPWMASPFFHAAIVNTYGPTECTDVCAFYRLHGDENATAASVPIGSAVPNTQLYILDEQLQVVHPGGEGELYIGGIGVGGGYLNRPELTAEKFLQNPYSTDKSHFIYRTGDRVRMREDGNIEFLGRVDHQVKIRGFRIELGEIEMQLSRHPQVRETIVVAREDTPGENRLVAYVVPKQRPAPPVSVLRCHLQAALPDYMLPTAWVFLEKLPLSPNGKIDRRALPAPAGIRPELGQAYASPRNDLEKHLCDIWCELLHLDRVGIHDRFFELGGTSIKAIQFISTLGTKFNLSIPIVKFFEEPTIAGFGQFLEKDFPGRITGSAGDSRTVLNAPAQSDQGRRIRRAQSESKRANLFNKRTEHRQARREAGDTTGKEK